MKEEKDFDFVVSHYKSHRFNADSALKKMSLHTTTWWRGTRIAAAGAILIVVGATAGILITRQADGNVEKMLETTTVVTTPDKDMVSVIDYDEAPLPVVIAEIEETYGVTIVNVPKNASELRLTIHYEGTAEDLLETINDILNTDLEIESL